MSLFQFCQFDLYQERCAHRLGTDSMLLGCWLNPYAERILDIGTGSGVLALMLAQRNPQSQIDAIDIDAESVEQAQQNFASSPWSERIQGFQADVKNWQQQDYDLLICNPPYFETPKRAAQLARANARHMDTLTHDEILSHARHLLKPTGRLAMVLPLQAATDLRRALAAPWHIARWCQVRHSIQHPYKRVLMELTLQAQATEETEFEIHAPDGGYSPAYLALTAGMHVVNG